jgi:hypothetical protein
MMNKQHLKEFSMKSNFFRYLLITVTLIGLIGGLAVGDAPGLAIAAQTARSEPLIINHLTRDITAIPQQWIEKAKTDLHIFYTHTSHGSQLSDGMAGLIEFANLGGKGLSLPHDIFDGLPFVDNYSTDLGDSNWTQITRDYLGTPNTSTGRGNTHPEINVVLWSWCGQLSWMEEQAVTDNYLTPMNQLEADYPGITFVYMTGHSDGSGETGNLHLRNQQIRQYALANNKVLYDFYDIEMYNPDGNYYGNKAATDNCNYDSNGDGVADDDANWCTEWQSAHTQNIDWYDTSCAHSQALNCNQKAYAAWWLWARLAGWNGNISGDDVAPSTPTSLTAQAISFYQVNLAWSASTDNAGGTGVAGYRIYRNGVEIGTSTTTNYADTAATPLQAYTYTVAAYDGAGNLSTQSTAAAANTPAAPFSVYLPLAKR